jgi:folylpolyglutamate synthase/dihydropteroate synthase
MELGRPRPALQRLAYPALRGANQLLNAAGVLAAFEALRDRLPITAQAVRTGLALVELPGRFQIVPGQPTLVLDVSHNPQSVAVLARNLDAMGFYPRTHAVFGAMRDKQLAGCCRRIRPLIDPGICATCRRRVPRRSTNWPRCWPAHRSAAMPTRPTPAPPRRPRPTPPIESSSSGRSSPSVAC